MQNNQGYADSAAISEELKYNREKAEEEASLLFGSCELTYSFLEDHLTKYIYYRLQLDPRAETDASIKDLLVESLEKTSKLPPELIEEAKSAQSCDGASTTAIKKALLLQSIQRRLDIRLNPEKAVAARTIRDITGVVWEAMQNSASWDGRMKF